MSARVWLGIIRYAQPNQCRDRWHRVSRIWSRVSEFFGLRKQCRWRVTGFVSAAIAQREPAENQQKSPTE